jgi:hypothetical protein
VTDTDTFDTTISSSQSQSQSALTTKTHTETVASHIPFPSGVTISPDRTQVAIASTTLGEILFYARDVTTQSQALSLRARVSTPFAPDNVIMTRTARSSSTELRNSKTAVLYNIMTCYLSTNFRTAHSSPVLHISQHPPHNVNYNNNTSSGRMRRTEGRKVEKYIITDRENLSQIKSGKRGVMRKKART